MKLTKWLNIFKLSLISLLILGGAQFTLAQQLTLQDCYLQAEELSPLKSKELYFEAIRELRSLERDQTNYPFLNISGTASYQSDVFSLPFDVPGTNVPVLPKDQYKLSLNLTQKIYDGGLTKSARLVDDAESNLQQIELEVSLYQIKAVINELYFGILQLQENALILGTLNNEYINQLKRAESGVKNGVTLQSTVRRIQKEQIKTDQQLRILEVRRIALLHILADWVEQDLSDRTELVLPNFEINTTSNNRPELGLFNQQMALLDVKEQTLLAGTRPQVFGFATGGWGSPNPVNFFEPTWQPFYIVGAKLEWDLKLWGTTNRQKELLKRNGQIVLSERENFDKNINRQVIQLRAQQQELELTIDTDNRLLALQKEITQEAKQQNTLGTLSATDYLTELNSKTQLEMQLVLHTIEQQKLKIELLTLTGNMP